MSVQKNSPPVKPKSDKPRLPADPKRAFRSKKAPALYKQLRAVCVKMEKLEGRYDPSAGERAVVMAQVRPLLERLLAAAQAFAEPTSDAPKADVAFKWPDA